MQKRFACALAHGVALVEGHVALPEGIRGRLVLCVLQVVAHLEHASLLLVVDAGRGAKDSLDLLARVNAGTLRRSRTLHMAAIFFVVLLSGGLALSPCSAPHRSARLLLEWDHLVSTGGLGSTSQILLHLLVTHGGWLLIFGRLVEYGHTKELQCHVHIARLDVSGKAQLGMGSGQSDQGLESSDSHRNGKLLCVVSCGLVAEGAVKAGCIPD